MRAFLVALLLLPGVLAPAAHGDAGDAKDAREAARAAVPAASPPASGTADGLAPAGAATWVWSDGGRADAADLPAALAWLAAGGLHHHRYPHLGMVAFVADAPTAAGLVAAAGGRVDPNEAMDLHLDKSVAFIDAERVRAEVGPARDGPTLLVVDTGIDSAHPDFDPQRNLAANVQTDRSGGLVVGVLAQQPVVDLAGHGTHVAGIAGGLAQALGPNDDNYHRFEGVYSNGRVAGFQASTQGTGPDIKVDTIAALEAFDWALANQERFDIRVVTNSWGTPGGFEAGNPVHQATRLLYLAGMTVVFSAGNEGEDGPGTLNRYCLAPWVLCVAAGDLSGARAGFSSYGRAPDPARPWDHPDLTAPGYQIRSAEPPATAPVGQSARDVLGGRTSDPLYRDRSGSSMAAPHVAAVAALVQVANPDLSPDQVMDVLTATTRPMVDPVEKAGTGYLDARAAYNLAVRTTGNRAAFLDGQAIKYAGDLSGDDLYGNDPVSQGYSGELRPGPTIPPGRDAAWVLTPYGGAVAALLALGAILNGAASLRFRRRLPR